MYEIPQIMKMSGLCMTIIHRAYTSYFAHISYFQDYNKWTLYTSVSYWCSIWGAW